jgi:hypothetical protein
MGVGWSVHYIWSDGALPIFETLVFAYDMGPALDQQYHFFMP